MGYRTVRPSLTDSGVGVKLSACFKRAGGMDLPNYISPGPVLSCI